MYSVSDETRKPIFEGVQGENESREIQFDISHWIEELGEGVCTATAKRPTDTTPYPVAVTRSGNVVTWKPNSTDTSIEGIGAFQLSFSIDSVVAKTRIWNTKIAPSLVGAGDPPDPYDDWIQDLRDIAAETLTYSQNAENSADDAEAEKLESEAWAKGTKNGTPVPSTADQYQNNSKYFAEESYKNAEAWAVGQRGGVDVPSTDPTYENNAKYWAEQSLANQYGAYIVKSASGDIASFADGGDDIPMKSLNVTITPKQSGSGDPSPSNVRPISGTSTANVFVTCKNLFGGEYSVKYDLFIPAGQAVTVSAHKTGSANLFFAVYSQSGSVIDYWTVTNTSGTRNYRTFTFAYDVYGVRFYNSASDYIQIELGSTPTDYVPYTGTTTPVPLGQTVYGGEVNPISGELKITHAMVDMGTLGWRKTPSLGRDYFFATLPNGSVLANPTITGNGNAVCEVFKIVKKAYVTITDNEALVGVNFVDNVTPSMVVYSSVYTDVNAFKTMLNGKHIVYELATPTTVQLTPTQVASLLGTNNVWADCGSVAVEYRADPTLAYNELANVIVSLGGNL